eukprot:2728775-Prymnesium_polylepis.1
MVGRNARAAQGAPASGDDAAADGAGARDDYAAGLAARAAIEANIRITHDAVPPHVDGASPDNLVMTWRDFTWHRRPQEHRALDAATLGILRAALDAADKTTERNALRARRKTARDKRGRAARGADDSARRVQQRRDDDEQQRRDAGARQPHVRTPASRARRTG